MTPYLRRPDEIAGDAGDMDGTLGCPAMMREIVLTDHHFLAIAETVMEQEKG